MDAALVDLVGGTLPGEVSNNTTGQGDWSLENRRVAGLKRTEQAVASTGGRKAKSNKGRLREKATTSEGAPSSSTGPVQVAGSGPSKGTAPITGTCPSSTGTPSAIGGSTSTALHGESYTAMHFASSPPKESPNASQFNGLTTVPISGQHHTFTPRFDSPLRNQDTPSIAPSLL